jgi:hypothetical protein
MFVSGSDLTPLVLGIDDLVAGLTRWKPRIQEERVTAPPKITVEGKDFREAISNVNKVFLKNRWCDGLPIYPPTKENIDWILTGTDLPRDKLVARILPRSGGATVETIAVNLAMAGGRPEYLPVLIGALEAITSPQFFHHRTNSTTCSVYPVVIANGPAARQIRLNSGYGCLGPDPVHPAGASIGRALRFILQNIGGAVPGITTMAIFGGPARYTSIVFAEDEAGIPRDWQPLSVEQGFGKGDNVVTAYAVSGTSNIVGGEAGNEESALETLRLAASYMACPDQNYFSYAYNPDGSPGILLMARGTAQGLSKLGWTKERVKDYLWENSKIPLRNALTLAILDMPDARQLLNQDPLPITMSPKGIKIVVAGGLQSGHTMWMQVGVGPKKVVSAEVRLPAGWNGLLEKAEEDLGPLPA